MESGKHMFFIRGELKPGTSAELMLALDSFGVSLVQLLEQMDEIELQLIIDHASTLSIEQLKMVLKDHGLTFISKMASTAS